MHESGWLTGIALYESAMLAGAGADVEGVADEGSAGRCLRQAKYATPIRCVYER